MWLVAPLPELVRGRPVVVHNNLHGDAVNMGAVYTDEDVVVDGDLVTAADGRPLPPVRAQDHRAARRREVDIVGPMHHIGLNCADPIAIERLVHEALRLRAQARLPARVLTRSW